MSAPSRPARHIPHYGPSRSWNSPWWRPIILTGVRGGDEWCNRTIGLRVPGGALFLNLNWPMRTQPCKECRP
ncbi:hypothetical protein [Kitasatospora purpeofusca]|uniref:hypothetical protein n=1 Tax=Kitasatospora purpeofusca TaxID=67352 RepID=UPI0036646308